MDTSKQMPNLIGAAHGAADGNRRILAQLEYGPKASSRAIGPARAWSFDGWTVGLVLLLLMLGGVAWLMHEENITPVTFKRHAEGRQDVKVTAAQDTVEAAADAATSEGYTARSATIINQPRLALSAPSGTFAAPSASTPAGQRNMASGSPGTAIKIDKAAMAANTAGTHKSIVAARGKPAPAAPNTRPGSRPAAQATSDTDVTLLTTLVAHANKPASVAHEPGRDVVERVDGVSTAHLLARCKQLGLMEGMLCRARICSGGWESDPVCRVPSN